MKQIKVTDTRMHEVKSFVSLTRGHKSEDVPVVEGKLVLINERDKPLFYVNNINPHFPKGYVDANFYTTERHPNDKRGIDRRIGDSKGRKIGLEGNNDYWLGKIPIIISETEKIEVGDWVYYQDDNVIFKCEHPNLIGVGEYKVLSLPEHFSPKHLQAIVDGKMKNGDKVLVECEDTYTEWTDAYSLEGTKMRKRPTKYPIKTIKLNSSGHVTLHKAEEKMYTKEEVRKLTKDAWVQGHYNPTTPEFEDWFEQNVK